MYMTKYISKNTQKDDVEHFMKSAQKIVQRMKEEVQKMDDDGASSAGDEHDIDGHERQRQKIGLKGLFHASMISLASPP